MRNRTSPTLPALLAGALLVTCVACRSLPGPARGGGGDITRFSLPEDVDPQCPYLRVFIDWSGGGGYEHATQRPVAHAYALHLRRVGFRVSDDPERAHWFAYSSAARSIQNDSMLIWAVRIRERPESIAGFVRFPKRYAPAASAIDVAELDLLFETHLARLDERAGRAAERAAALFMPRVVLRCRERGDAAGERQARLEALREELAGEIARVRGRRAEPAALKGLEIEVEGPREEPR